MRYILKDNKEKLTKARLADLVMKFAFLFTNIFTDAKFKQVGKTISITKGPGGAVGSAHLSYGSCFVEFDCQMDKYIVLLSPNSNSLGSVKVQKASGGFHILSDLKNDFGTVDYLVVKVNEA